MFGTHSDVKKAVDIMDRVIAGDFEARLTHISAKGDLGILMNRINDLIDRTDAYIRESAAAMEHVSHAQYYRKIVETSMQGSFLNASRTVNKALD
ncbi:MAG: chemotaxis protein, partial [Alphaproteobacteria bacterium]|nr:chemotaxis protein [Alphaproteobacteria bacterium]